MKTTRKALKNKKVTYALPELDMGRAIHRSGRRCKKTLKLK